MNFTQIVRCAIIPSETNITMPDLNQKTPSNVPGPYYVDDSCIDCDMCRNTAPVVFGRDDSIGLSVVFRQPTTDEEIALAIHAMDECPSASIGANGI